MDEKDDPRKHAARYRNERVRSRNLSEKKRRDQFNMLINELCSMVASSSRKMDKSTVLKSAISFLRNHNEMSVQQQSVEVQENWKPSFLSNEEFTHLMLEALDGFIMVFSSTGKILYTSESITSLLGYLPSDIPSSVFDMVHECDRPALYKAISSPDSTSSKDSCFSIFVHMKRGPIFSKGTKSYELIRLIGTFHHWPSSSVEGTQTCNTECDSNSCSSICSPLSSTTLEWPVCIVAMARLQTPQLLRVVNLSDEPKNEFTSRHSLEWTFLFLDHRAPPIIGYLPFEVLGTSGYDYYHVDDLENVAAGHKMLMQTGEGTSCYYRFLTKGQQWIWLQTRYFISYHQWSSKPEFVVCTNVVVSNEHVQNSFRRVPQKQASFLGKTSSFSSLTPSATPNQSACQSPSPSPSSLGSLSSEHSEKCTATVNKTSTVLFPTCGREENSGISVTPAKSQACTVDKGAAITSTENIPSVPAASQPDYQSHTPSSRSHVFVQQQQPQLQVSHRAQSATPTAAVPFVTIAALHPTPAFLGVPAPSPLANAGLPQAQCETSPSSQLPAPLHMTSSQSELQEYLRKRHQLLQQQILMQQEELQRVSEQLMLVQFVAPPAQNVPYSVPVTSFASAPVSSVAAVCPATALTASHSTADTCITQTVDQFNRSPRTDQVPRNVFANSQAATVFASQELPDGLHEEVSSVPSSQMFSSSDSLKKIS